MQRKGPLSVIAILALLVCAPMAHAATPLPSTNFGDMVVDAAHSHVFVSSGSDGSSVFVLDYDGNLVETIAGLSWPSGMALDPSTSTLYVALAGGSGIETIDTATLTATGELSVAPWTGPHWLGIAGGRLWFSHDCITSPDAGMASIALDGTDLQTPSGADLPYYCPIFAPSPADPNVLAVVDVGVSPSIIYVYDVSTATPSVIVKKSDPVGGGGEVSDLVFSPDGTQLLGASPTANGVAVFSLSDLSRVRTYTTGPYANAAAITSDGSFVAAGRNASSDPDVYVYKTSTLTVARSFQFAASGNTLLAGGLAFSPDKSRLFAVSFPEPQISFRAIVSPTAVQRVTSTSLTLSATKAQYNRAITLTAHVTGSKTGNVSIYATAYGETKTLVKSGPLNVYGNFSATFRPAKKTTFTAEYGGTDVYAPSKSGGKVVYVYAVATVIMGNYYAISGKYKLYHRGAYPEAIGGLKPTHFGSKLKFVVQRYYLGAWRAAASNTFPADGGTVWAQFISTTRGTYRIHTVFGGDAENLADTSPWAYFKITA